MVKLYWLSDGEWARLEPLMPRGRRGAHRVDDRRVISGIMHMLRSGARWRDCPSEYGPYTTIYNRFNRWSRQDVWTDIFYALTGSTGRIGTMSIESMFCRLKDFRRIATRYDKRADIYLSAILLAAALTWRIN